MPAVPFSAHQAIANGVRFRPTHGMYYSGAEPVRVNPMSDDIAGALAARIVVGFNVGKQPKWKIGDLVALVRETRQAQGVPPDATFYTQEGLFTHPDNDPDPDLRGQTIHEHGAQVVVLNVVGETDEQFAANALTLAETIAEVFQQHSVILEFQVRGVVKTAHFIYPIERRV